MTRAWVGLGANLGDAAGTLNAVFAELDRLPGTTLVTRSSLYRTAPVDAQGPDFINAVAGLETELAARALLTALLDIEAQHARVRSTRNAPRTLDLDLLLFGDETVRSTDLVVPHPRMGARAFVLVPLIEVAPAIVIPGQGRAADLLAGLPNQSVARIEDRHP